MDDEILDSVKDTMRIGVGFGQTGFILGKLAGLVNRMLNLTQYTKLDETINFLFAPSINCRLNIDNLVRKSPNASVYYDFYFTVIYKEKIMMQQ